MTEETWESIAARLDALDALEKRRAERDAKKSVKVKPVDSRAVTREKQRAAGKRVQEKRRGQTQAEYEAEMNERIRTMCPQIQAENYAKNLDEQVARDIELYGTGLDFFG